jgi:predicted nucleotidyltransferase
MAMSPGFFRKQKTLRRTKLEPKGKGILMGVPGMTNEWKGETVQMPEAFGIKSENIPNFAILKAKHKKHK